MDIPLVFLGCDSSNGEKLRGKSSRPVKVKVPVSLLLVSSIFSYYTSGIWGWRLGRNRNI